MKTYLFVCQELSRDIECQLKGVVLIGFPLQTTIRRPLINPSVAPILRSISQKIVPVRIAAFHCCIQEDPWFRLAATLILQVLPKPYRLRSRVHIGKIRISAHLSSFVTASASIYCFIVSFLF